MMQLAGFGLWTVFFHEVNNVLPLYRTPVAEYRKNERQCVTFPFLPAHVSTDHYLWRWCSWQGLGSGHLWLSTGRMNDSASHSPFFLHTYQLTTTCEDDAVGRVLAPVLHEVHNIPHSERGVPGEEDAGHAEVAAQLWKWREKNTHYHFGVDCFNIALFSALWSCDSESVTSFLRRTLNIHPSGVAAALFGSYVVGATRNCCHFSVFCLHHIPWCFSICCSVHEESAYKTLASKVHADFQKYFQDFSRLG